MILMMILIMIMIILMMIMIILMMIMIILMMIMMMMIMILMIVMKIHDTWKISIQLWFLELHDSPLELKGELQYLGENCHFRGEKMTILV